MLQSIIMSKSPFAHGRKLSTTPYGIRLAGNVCYSIGLYFLNESSSKEPMELPPPLLLLTTTLYMISQNYCFIDTHIRGECVVSSNKETVTDVFSSCGINGSTLHASTLSVSFLLKHFRLSPPDHKPISSHSILNLNVLVEGEGGQDRQEYWQA